MIAISLKTEIFPINNKCIVRGIRESALSLQRNRFGTLQRNERVIYEADHDLESCGNLMCERKNSSNAVNVSETAERNTLSAYNSNKMLREIQLSSLISGGLIKK